MSNDCNDKNYIEKRKLLFFTLNYFWMDKDAFLSTDRYISLLRTHDNIPEEYYSIKIVYQTLLIDLSQSKDEIFKDFDSSSARYEVRKALKKGVRVFEADDSAEKDRFFEFYQEFSNRPGRKNKILTLQKDELDQLIIFYALSAEGEYLGGIGLLPSPDKHYLLYKYAATKHKISENELLIWHAIQHAKESHFRFFDMSWMPLSIDKNSDLYRIFQFKKKFGGEPVEFYSYVRITGPFVLFGVIFKGILKYFFKNDINRFAEKLKKMRVFK